MSKYFTEDHEWIVVEGEMATVGITDHAQDQLGDIVFVELPEVDEEYGKGDDISVVESVKAAGDVHNPVSGTVVEVNETLEDEPATVNTSPEGDGWIYKIKLSDETELDDLMDEAAYQAFITE
ncbi:MAG: glycine cleavage system protein H [Gammaproteobacteria bacterium]|nr:MAG: glycine cleavage system protein H [Gammaproteobacteria bacterium]